MPRYFIQVAYKGTNYSGFQVQDNANSIQAEIEKALEIVYKVKFDLTGSSRTDAGVHARQNFFHVDIGLKLNEDPYNLNAILPLDIVIKKIYLVAIEAHCRFNATSREYHYYIYQQKNPFLQDIAYYIPYTIDVNLLNQAAEEILKHTNFTSFSKRNTQVKTFLCTVYKSVWEVEGDCLVYKVRANRFLRGMVKGLVGTMLLAGKSKITLAEFRTIIEGKDCTNADFSVPAKGLFLHEVTFQ